MPLTNSQHCRTKKQTLTSALTVQAKREKVSPIFIDHIEHNQIYHNILYETIAVNGFIAKLTGGNAQITPITAENYRKIIVKLKTINVQHYTVQLKEIPCCLKICTLFSRHRREQ